MTVKKTTSKAAVVTYQFDMPTPSNCDVYYNGVFVANKTTPLTLQAVAGTYLRLVFSGINLLEYDEGAGCYIGGTAGSDEYSVWAVFRTPPTGECRFTWVLRDDTAPNCPIPIIIKPV